LVGIEWRRTASRQSRAARKHEGQERRPA
jgi:hypothetical protein